MKRKTIKKAGFTIVEVALFLAVSGILMIGLIAGSNLSISRQRYNDSVNNFAELLRGTYSDVLNVSNDKDPNSAETQAGRTTTAVYGKLISIGERDPADPNTIDDAIYSYDIVGRAVSSSSINTSRVIDMMFDKEGVGQKSGINSNIYATNCNTNPVNCLPNTFYRETVYNIPWSGIVTRGGSGKDNGNRFRGAILVLRSPVTGSIRTYTFDYDNDALSTALNNANINTSFHYQSLEANAYSKFRQYLEVVSSVAGGGESEDGLTFCIDSDDNTFDNRRGVNIAARASNSSGITLLEMDDDNGYCKGRSK
ncbi:type II secretion system protein [Candidatus Saccharibacteria bacterium]|nr:type II secretion system protein [Candidatus Saccharibacteria bacterium]